MAESDCRHHCCVSVRTEEGLLRGLPAMPRELVFFLAVIVLISLCLLTCNVLNLLGVPVSTVKWSPKVGEKWTQPLLLCRQQPTMEGQHPWPRVRLYSLLKWNIYCDSCTINSYVLDDMHFTRYGFGLVGLMMMGPTWGDRALFHRLLIRHIGLAFHQSKS